MSEAVKKSFVPAMTLAVILALFGGFWILGSPETQRAVRLDGTRINSLASMTSAVNTATRQLKRLPKTIEEVRSAETYLGANSFTDPVTKQPFDYNAKDSTTYEICATFDTDNRGGNIDDDNGWQKQFAHGKGRTCFERKVTLPN